MLCYILIKNDQKWPTMTKKCQKIPKNLWYPMKSYWKDLASSGRFWFESTKIFHWDHKIGQLLSGSHEDQQSAAWKLFRANSGYTCSKYGTFFMRFGFFPVFVDVLIGVYEVLIIPKWLIKVPRWYCNTFWMISGTSKIFAFYGPLSLLFITILLQKNKKKGNHLRKILSSHISTFWTSMNLWFLERQAPKKSPNKMLKVSNVGYLGFLL